MACHLGIVLYNMHHSDQLCITITSYFYETKVTGTETIITWATNKLKYIGWGGDVLLQYNPIC